MSVSLSLPLCMGGFACVCVSAGSGKTAPSNLNKLKASANKKQFVATFHINYALQPK